MIVVMKLSDSELVDNKVHQGQNRFLEAKVGDHIHPSCEITYRVFLITKKSNILFDRKI